MERPKRGNNRRRSPRVLHADLLAYCDRRKDGLYHILGTGRTADLSETGLRATCPEPLPLGQVLSFEIKIGDLTHPFKGRIVWCAELEADKRYEFGVRFQELDFGLARSLMELTGDSGSTDQIRLSTSESSEVGSSKIDEVEPARFSPLSNRPLDRDDSAERDLVKHLVGRAAGDDYPASLEELLQRALAHGPKGGFSSAAELRDALARAAESLAAKVESSTRGSPTSARSTPTPPRGLIKAAGKQGRMTPPPRPGGMAGHFKGDQLLDFVQMLGLTGRTGVLQVLSPTIAGHVAFRDGRVVAARTHDDQRAEAGVYAILSLPQGDFRFRPDHLVHLVVEHELAVEGLLLEVARRRDEGEPGRRSQEPRA